MLDNKMKLSEVTEPGYYKNTKDNNILYQVYYSEHYHELLYLEWYYTGHIFNSNRIYDLTTNAGFVKNEVNIDVTAQKKHYRIDSYGGEMLYEKDVKEVFCN